MPARFLDNFAVVLLDMGRTFMFDVDRFDGGFAETYAALGGRELDGEFVDRIMREAYRGMMSLYEDPAWEERFPKVADYLAGMPETRGLSRREMKLLEQVFARHEMGTIPADSVLTLNTLRQRARLGLVSNIFSPSAAYRRLFRALKIHDLFDVIVFSSDFGWLKPSPRLYREAMKAFRVPPAKMVMVGDNPRRDVAGAKALGLSAVYIDTGRRPADPRVPPDRTIRSLPELLEE